MSVGRSARPPSRRRLLAIVGASVLGVAALLAGVVLPAEFHVDPLGIGNASGLMALSAPKPANAPIAHAYPQPWRSDTIEIPLAAGGDPQHGDELEWKLRMKAGQALVYAWTVEASSAEFYADFHGQSDPAPAVHVTSYKAGLGNAENGALVAPFDGIHGWYLQNQSEHAVVVRLRVAGFYTLRPDPYAPE